MKQEELFAEQLKELREMSELSGEEITIDDIRPAYYKWAGKWIITGKTNPFGSTRWLFP